LSVLSAAYGQVARLRRSWYARRPHAKRRLDRPVVSVGNLVVGGSGKTPVVAALARLLLASGQRPAVLSRGYARRRSADGVIVVSDGTRVLESAERSGDEPLMLARQLPGVPVLVSPDRFLAGRLAERRLGATVLLLDDGFQHIRLQRTVDLLLVDPADLHEQVLPSGRLREPLEAASSADAVLVTGDADAAAEVARLLGVPRSFMVTRQFAPLRSLRGPGAVQTAGRTVVAVSGIARPARFHAALRDGGWTIAREMAFPDHHWFTPRDLARVSAAAHATGADLVVTTEKDAVRLEDRVAPDAAVPWACLPMDATIEPAAEFSSWLRNAL
jgi:tetraacyldisaccharide 4'-kinase